MTKSKKDVKFNHRERRMSKSSMSDVNYESPTESRSPTRSIKNGGQRNGSFKDERPGMGGRTDTTASGWQTENEDEKVGPETGESVRRVALTFHQPAPKTQSDYDKKKQTFITRSIWTFVMIGIFFGGMFAGHIYMLIMVTAIQVLSFKEVIAISNVPSRARSLRFTKTLNWYFLGSTMYFLYGESVIYYFKHIVLIDRVLLPFATHHRFISFMLYVIGEWWWMGEEPSPQC
jgi:phosphatidate cytidylyltransferase